MDRYVAGIGQETVGHVGINDAATGRKLATTNAEKNSQLRKHLVNQNKKKTRLKIKCSTIVNR